MFHSSGVYSVRSFYAIVNNRGVIPVHSPAVWNLRVPPRLHIFLWLLSKNKLLTRDNLAKRRHVEDASCVFCSEPESCSHLFFDCFVAKLIWPIISDIIGVQVGVSFESVARWWISEKRNSLINTVCTAVLWAIWKLRNEICFQGKVWPGVHDIWRRVASDLELWKILSSDAVSELLSRNAQLLNKMRGDVLRIAWK